MSDYRLLLLAALSLFTLPVYSHAGPLPPEMAAWTEADKQSQRESGDALLEMIDAAVQRGDSLVQIPVGDYRFNRVTADRRPTHILWRNLHDITIDFQGSTLWFETQHSGIVLAGGRNVVLKNVTFDWDPLPFAQGTITAMSSDPDTLDIRLDPGYEREHVSPGLVTSGNWSACVFDPQTRELRPGQARFMATLDWDKRRANGDYEVAFRSFYGTPLANCGLHVGDKIFLCQPLGRALRLEGTSNTLLENVTFYASPFVTIAQNGGTGTTIRDCRIVRRPDTDRLMASNRDGINCANMDKGPLIEDCEMEFIGDDFVNVHGSLSRVLWQESPTQVITSRLNNRGNIDTPVEISFHDRATMRPLGTRVAQRMTTDTWLVTREKCLADLSHKWHSGEASLLDYGKPATVHRLELDRPIDLPPDAIIVCEAFSSPGAIIRNNEFRSTIARGIRLQSPDALIEGNHISYTALAAITLFGHASFWGEGPFVHTTRVIGNTVEDACLFQFRSTERAAIVVREGNYRDNQLPYDITISDNDIAFPGNTAISVRGVNGAVITGNTISRYATLPAWPARDGQSADDPGTGYAIAVEASTDVTLSDNTITDPGPLSQGDVLFLDSTPNP